MGTVKTFQPFVAPMRAAGGGTLAGISSVAAVRGLPGAGAYSASKAAMVSYLESLRVELRPAGVRVVTVNGLLVTTDAEGRFHVACADIPQLDRGSNFVMKLDERTLPSGYRLTTENPHSVRTTRGKLVRLNFGAAIHRVVRIEVSDAAFEPGTERLQAAWQRRIDALPGHLRERPSVVRVAYVQGTDASTLVARRVEALIRSIRQRWEDYRRAQRSEDCCYPLTVEDESGAGRP